jgi:hypothetical protein
VNKSLTALPRPIPSNERIIHAGFELQIRICQDLKSISSCVAFRFRPRLASTRGYGDIQAFNVELGALNIRPIRVQGWQTS